jgi:hypothetical protein
MPGVGRLRIRYKKGKSNQMSNITFTIPGQKEITITHEDAVKYIIDFLRKPRQHSYGDYGYDLYLDTMLIIYCKVHHRTLFFLLNGDMELHRNRHLFV